MLYHHLGMRISLPLRNDELGKCAYEHSKYLAEKVKGIRLTDPSLIWQNIAEVIVRVNSSSSVQDKLPEAIGRLERHLQLEGEDCLFNEQFRIKWPRGHYEAVGAWFEIANNYLYLVARFIIPYSS